jgi:hypothetical protein
MWRSPWETCWIAMKVKTPGWGVSAVDDWI